jgi:hypothetical protein
MTQFSLAAKTTNSRPNPSSGDKRGMGSWDMTQEVKVIFIDDFVDEHNDNRRLSHLPSETHN